MPGDQKIKAESVGESSSLHYQVTELKKSKHKEAANKLRDSKQVFKTIFDNAADGLVLASVDNKKFYLANKVFCQLLGYNLQEIKNLGVSDIHPEKELPYVVEQFESLANNEIRIAKDIPVKRKDGSVFYADVNSFPINLDGKTYLMGIFRDITDRRQMEKSLKESKEKLKKYIDGIATGISIISPKMEILYINKTIRNWLPAIDISKKPICYKSLYDPPKEGICSYCPTVKAFKDAKSHYSETDLCADGNYYLVSASPLIDDKGKVTAVIETVQNITGIKEMEHEVKKNQAQAWSLIQTSPDVILYISSDYKILEYNAEAERHFGYKRDDVLGQDFFELLVQEWDRERVAADIEKVLAGEPTRNYESPLITPDGSEYIFSWNVNRVLDSNEQPLGIIAVGQDITERKKWENMLLESEEKFRLAMEATNDALWDWNMVTNETYRNARHATMLGYEPQELSTSQDEWVKRIHPNDRQFVLGIDSELLTGKRASFEIEYRLRTKSGDYIWVLGRGKVVGYSDDGSPLRMIGTNIDITERKEVERKIEKFKKMADNAPYGCAMSDLEGNLTYINDSFTKMHGYAPDELIGKNLEIFHNNKQLKHVRGLKKSLVEADQCLNDEEVWHTHRDGTEFPTLMNSWTIKDKSGNPTMICTTSIDITERKKTDERLQIMYSAIESSIDGIAISDTKGNLTYVNNTFLKMWGYKDDKQVLGRNASEFWQTREKALQVVKMVQNNENWVGELTAERKDGSTFDVQLSATCVKDDNGELICLMGSFVDITAKKKAGEEVKKLSFVVEQSIDGMAVSDFEQKLLYVNNAFAQMFGYISEDMIGMPLAKLHNEKQIGEHQNILYSLKKQDSWRGEVEHMRKDGTLFPTYTSMSLLKGDVGESIGKVLIVRDISEIRRRENEINIFKEKMVRTEQLASLGTLSAAVAHELAQPLTIVLFLIEDALDKLEAISSTDIVTKKLNDCLEEFSHIKSIFDRLKNHARLPSDNTVSKVDLKKIAQNITNLLKDNAQRAGITLHLSNMDKLPPVYSNKKDMEQLFFTLVDNAILTADREKHQQLIISGTVKNEHIELQFSDNCGGITSENIGKIFEPFFTTRPEGQGTGLGLPVVQHIVSRMRGKVWVESEAGKGSTFFVKLPLNSSIVEKKG